MICAMLAVVVTLGHPAHDSGRCASRDVMPRIRINGHEPWTVTRVGPRAVEAYRDGSLVRVTQRGYRVRILAVTTKRRKVRVRVRVDRA